MIEPRKLGLGIVIMGVLFLSAYFNWGNHWKSRKRKRRFMMATCFAALSGVAQLLPETNLALPNVFRGWLNAAGVVFFVLAAGYAVAVFATPNEPP